MRSLRVCALAFAPARLLSRGDAARGVSDERASKHTRQSSVERSGRRAPSGVLPMWTSTAMRCSRARALVRAANRWPDRPSIRTASLSTAAASSSSAAASSKTAAQIAMAQEQMLETIESIPPERIRNLCIIAHVDHGKSTLADRLMGLTGAVPEGQGRAQLLDSLSVERERGITVKAQTVSLLHTCERSGETYLVNLIDTPGHVDFAYEVSRSMAACQGALLLVDATKGVQAQTVANFFLAFEQELAIVPVVNKVDLPHADVAGALGQLSDAFDIDTDDDAEPPLTISAKTGLGCESLLPAVLERIPPPIASSEIPLRLLLFDSWYDEYEVLCLVEVLGGRLSQGMAVQSAASGRTYNTSRVALMRPLGQYRLSSLGPGQVGCVSLGMKSIDEALLGDTLFEPSSPQPALPGFQRPVPMVFAGLFPTSESGYEELKFAMDRFMLTDGSVTTPSRVHRSAVACAAAFSGCFTWRSSSSVFSQSMASRCSTAPTVPLKATLTDGTQKAVLSPTRCPSAASCASSSSHLSRSRC